MFPPLFPTSDPNEYLKLGHCKCSTQLSIRIAYKRLRNASLWANRGK
jgi:hypothetical protein